MNPEEAAQNLATIRRTQAKAIGSEPWFPTWYAVGVGLYVTGIQCVTEQGTPVPVTVGGAVLLSAALGALIALLVKTRRITAHRSLLSSAVIAFTTWLLVAIAITFVLALVFESREVAYGRTYAALVMTAWMAATGPFVARLISRRMARKIEESS
jgi:hypothetical protein